MTDSTSRSTQSLYPIPFSNCARNLKGCFNPPVGSLVERVELAAQEFVHGEHVYSSLLEYRLQFVIAAYLTLVGRLLQVIRFDVFPQLLDDLRT